MTYFEKMGITKQKSLKTEKIVRSGLISCSRRTDIPAFLMNWVIDRINDGFVKVKNPFNQQQVSKVSMDPNDVKCWIWWSKDFKNWIKIYKKKPEIFSQYKGHFFNFTINSPSDLESGLITSLEERLNQLKWLINEFGIDHIQYRYDPIVFYRIIESKKNINKIINNLDKFEYIVSKVSKFGVEELIFSFATIYSKVHKRMLRRGKEIIALSLEKKKNVLDELIEICNSYKIAMHACCQPDLYGYKGIKQAHCINGEKINSVLKNKIVLTRDKGQRDSCGCTVSRDIGGYSGLFKCGHNCDYCYANPTRK